MTLHRFRLDGEELANADGTDRQWELDRSEIGERVTLERGTAASGETQIRVFSCRGIEVGHIAFKDAGELAAHLEAGGPVQAAIENLGETRRGFSTITIMVSTGPEPPIDPRPQPPRRPTRAEREAAYRELRGEPAKPPQGCALALVAAGLAGSLELWLRLF